MSGKCSFWFTAITSTIGIYCGITIFFLFSFYYGNVSAGAFGLISATFAAICLHLCLLNRRNRLVLWYTPRGLRSIGTMGIFFSLLALAFTLWYILTAVHRGIPMLPVKSSYYLVAVWSGMTCKWALTTGILSFRYARLMEYNTPFLIIQEQS